MSSLPKMTSELVCALGDAVTQQFGRDAGRLELGDSAHDGTVLVSESPLGVRIAPGRVQVLFVPTKPCLNPRLVQASQDKRARIIARTPLL